MKDLKLVKKGPKLEQVRWRDAFFLLDEPDVDPEDYVVVTTGWVIELPLFLKVIGEMHPEGNGNRAVTYIPNEMVLERTNLAIQD